MRSTLITGIILIILLGVIGCGSPTSHEIVSGPFRVGAILPLTGPASYPGEQAKLGIESATQEINQSGGINHRQINLIIEDSQTNPAQGVAAFKKLVEVDQVDVVISALSSVSMSIAPLAKQNQVPLIGIMSTAKEFTQNEWIFRYQPLTDLEVKPIMETIDRLDLKKVGILYLNDEFGVSTFNFFTQNLASRGKEVIGESYEVSNRDFNHALLKFKDIKVDALYIVGFDSHLVKIIKRLDELDFNKVILSASPLSLPMARDKIKNINHKIYVACPPIYLEGELNSYSHELARLLQKKDQTVNHYNALGYDVIRFLDSALENNQFSSQREIKDLVEEIKSHSGPFGKLSISQNGHEIAYTLYPAVIEKGKIKKF